MARTELQFIVKANDRELEKLNKQLAKFQKESKQSVVASQKLDGGMTGMIKTVGGLAVAYVSLNAVISKTEEIVSTGLSFEALNQKLVFATGSAETATNTFKSLQQETENLGINFLQSAQAFASFAAVTKGTQAEGKVTREIFTGMATAAAALKLSTDDTAGALRQFGQIASKGKVQTEELMTIAERGIPIYRLLANSMRISTKELSDMLQKGDVLATDILPGLGKALKEEFGKAAEDNADSAAAAFARFGNAIDDLENTIAQSGVVDFLADMATGVTGFLNSLKAIESRGIRQLEGDIAETTEKLAELQTEAENSIMPDVFNFAASRAKLLDGELQRLLDTYTKLIEKQEKTPLGVAQTKAQKPPIDQSALRDMSHKIFVAYDDGLTKATNKFQDDMIAAFADVEEVVSSDFAKGLQGIFASTITDGIVQGLEGDLDPQAFIKSLGSTMLQYGLMLTLTTSTAITAGMAAAFSGVGAIVAGAALIGLSGAMGGGGGPKISLSDRADKKFQSLIDAIEDNTEILSLTRAGTAEVQEQAAIQERIVNLTTDIALGKEISPIFEKATANEGELRGNALQEFNTGVRAAQRELADMGLNIKDAAVLVNGLSVNELVLADLKDEQNKREVEDTIKLGQFGKVSADQAKRFFTNQGANPSTFLAKLASASANANEDLLFSADILTGEMIPALSDIDKEILRIAEDSPEAVDALRAMNEEIEASSENFKSMADSLGSTISMQDNFILSQMQNVQSGGENLAFLEDELAIKDALADATREAVEIAGTAATPEMIANLAQQEQDVVSVAGLLSQRATEVGGSSEEATRLQQLSIDTVDENMKETISIEQFMLTEQKSQTKSLSDIAISTAAMELAMTTLSADIATEVARNASSSYNEAFNTGIFS